MANIIVPKRNDIIQDDGFATLRFHRWMEQVSDILSATSNSIETFSDGSEFQGAISRLGDQLRGIQSQVEAMKGIQGQLQELKNVVRKLDVEKDSNIYSEILEIKKIIRRLEVSNNGI